MTFEPGDQSAGTTLQRAWPDAGSPRRPKAAVGGQGQRSGCRVQRGARSYVIPRSAVGERHRSVNQSNGRRQKLMTSDQLCGER